MESVSSIPSSASTFATPPISESVFLFGNEASIFISRRSGRIDEKMLACFTCPAIMIWVIPSVFRILISFPNSPIEIQWQRNASVSTSGAASPCRATTTTS